jgi:hypothetical protein
MPFNTYCGSQTELSTLIIPNLNLLCRHSQPDKMMTFNEKTQQSACHHMSQKDFKEIQFTFQRKILPPSSG